MTRRRHWMIAGLSALALLGAVEANAIERATGGPASLRAASDPALEAAPSLVTYEMASSAAAGVPTLQGFLNRHGVNWEVRWDERNDRPHLIQGQGIPLIPGRGNDLTAGQLGLAPGEDLGLRHVADLLEGFIRDHGDLLRVPLDDLRLDGERSHGYGPGNSVWFVEFQQVHRGVPVVGANVFFRVNHGNIVQLGVDRYAEVKVETRPSIGRERAWRSLLGYAGIAGGEVREVLDRGTLQIHPVLTAGESVGERFTGTAGGGYAHRLAWSFRFRRAGDDATYGALVDAHSGAILRLVDENRTADVTGGIYPVTNTDPEEVRGFPFCSVSNNGTKITDANGSYNYTGGTATTTLNGRYIRINDNCGAISLSNSSTGNLAFGTSGGTDCTTPGFGGAGNTHAARSGFYHLTNINRKAATFLPGNAWLNGTLTANMNINNTCNAFWNGSTVNFYRSGGGCANTGELAAVFLHEWGHGMDTNSGGSASENGSGEAVGDTFAFLETRDACIGDNFLSSACANCDPDCSGVRDVDAFALGGSSTIARPSTVTSNSGINCDRFSCPYTTPQGFPYRGPMGYEGHCESYIASTANWDLTQMLIGEHGTEAGWSTMDSIWYGSLTPSKSAYRVASGGQCNPNASVDGCGATNWYTVYLPVDDDDGNLANGTPNACRIWDAFDAHGIACGSRPQCSSTCNPAPIADAGPDQTICQGESALIGTPAQGGHSYSWSPGGQTAAQISVSPSSTTAYTVTATTTCGSAQDSVLVTVDSGAGGGLSDDLEGSTAGWSTTGLWHLTNNSSCASPGYSSATRAFYYGQDSTCTYNAGDNTGDLISPVISGINSSSTLTFDYYRVVESYSGGSFDQTQVAVSVAGSGSWTTVWSRDSTNASTAAWTSSGPISLAAFAGSDVQVRFRFDTVDGSFNSFTGWFIDDLEVTGDSPCGPGNTAPTVTITAPANGHTVTVGTAINFTGTASDTEDGSLTAGLSWSSSIDGTFGSGGSVVTSGLSIGTHTITASVTDSGGLPGSDAIAVTVNPAPNTAPAVNITSPADGTAVDEGTSVTFNGSAIDSEDGNLTASLSWSSNLDGVIGSGGGFSTSGLSVGNHTVTASVTDSGGLQGSDQVGVTVNAVGGCTGCIDWSTTPTVSYSNQDVSGNVTVEDGGDTLLLLDNTWRRTTQTFNVTPNTVLEVEFAGNVQGEIHGIGFDENDSLNDATRIFQFWGTQNWNNSFHDFDDYTGGGGFKPYVIPVGQFYTGSAMYLVLTNDNDAGSGNDSRFRNVRVYEDTPPPGSCAADVDFESGAAGWTNSGASTCSTGSFVVAAPTQVTNGGVVTQVGGDHSNPGTNAFFTATNSSAGVNDVDGGNCIALSPVYPVSEASDVSVWYFHGQRDTGGDPSGDFFRLEISTNGGASWSTLASNGDTTSNAAWTQATTTVAAGTNVQFRVQASDGTASGDLVEAGVDDVSICPSN